MSGAETIAFVMPVSFCTCEGIENLPGLTKVWKFLMSSVPFEDEDMSYKFMHAISTMRSRSFDNPVVSKSNTMTVGIFLSFAGTSLMGLCCSFDNVSFSTVEEDNTPFFGEGALFVLFTLVGGCHPATRVPFPSLVLLSLPLILLSFALTSAITIGNAPRMFINILSRSLAGSCPYKTPSSFIRRTMELDFNEFFTNASSLKRVNCAVKNC